MTGSHSVQPLLDQGRPVRVLAHGEDKRSKRLQELEAEGPGTKRVPEVMHAKVIDTSSLARVLPSAL